MLKNKWTWIIAGLIVLGGINNCVKRCNDYREQPKLITAWLDDAEKNMDDVERKLNFMGHDITEQEASALLETFADIKTDKYDIDDANTDELKNRIRQMLNKHRSLEGTMQRTLTSKNILLPQSGDTLLTSTVIYPVYLERGETLYYDVKAESSVTVRVLNAERHSVAEIHAARKTVSGTMPVRFPAIYLVEVTPRGREYATVSVGYKAASLERITYGKKLTETTENCQRGDFMAKQVSGIKMTPAFEEPRKLTLRGQLKAAFSGSAVALVPIQIPKGATDILYNLRISTNETVSKGEKDFYEGMDLSYKKIKVLGLPIYESHGGSGLLTTLLGLNQPVREEDAYINMYVFYDAAQARKFQNGTPVSQLKYSLDYSTIGTQSCNGCIPTRGHSTVYLAFENERVRYNNYVWLSALLSVPTTEYVRTKYSVN